MARPIPQGADSGFLKKVYQALLGLAREAGAETSKGKLRFRIDENLNEMLAKRLKSTPYVIGTALKNLKSAGIYDWAPGGRGKQPFRLVKPAAEAQIEGKTAVRGKRPAGAKPAGRRSAKASGRKKVARRKSTAAGSPPRKKRAAKKRSPGKRRPVRLQVVTEQPQNAAPAAERAETMDPSREQFNTLYLQLVESVKLRDEEIEELRGKLIEERAAHEATRQRLGQLQDEPPRLVLSAEVAELLAKRR